MFGDAMIPQQSQSNDNGQDSSQQQGQGNWMQMLMDYIRRQQQMNQNYEQNKPMPFGTQANPAIGQPMQNYTGQPIGVQPKPQSQNQQIGPQSGPQSLPGQNNTPSWSQPSSPSVQTPNLRPGGQNYTNQGHNLTARGGLW